MYYCYTFHPVDEFAPSADYFVSIYSVVSIDYKGNNISFTDDTGTTYNLPLSELVSIGPDYRNL